MLSLSTCNRVEILAVGKGNIVGLEIDAWARARGHSTSELAATHRIQAGIRTVQVTNRTYERAKELGSGLIIPNEVKTGYTEDMEVSHAYPVLPFRKPDGTDQPFLSPLSRYPPCR